jgi:hypothetical protein
VERARGFDRYEELYNMFLKDHMIIGMRGAFGGVGSLRLFLFLLFVVLMAWI